MQSVSTPSTASRWEQLVAGMPRPDKEEKILQNVEEGQIEKIVADLLAGGREAVVALVDMLVEPGSDRNDSPARHALHALVVHVGGLTPEDRWRTGVALVLTLSDRDRPTDVKRFVIQQLQWCGTPIVRDTLGALLSDEQLSADAAMALLAIRVGAGEQFRKVLPDLTGPQRVAVIQALGLLKDLESVGALRRVVARDVDPVARLESAWALASIGDAGSVEAVLRIAEEARGFDQTRATAACLLLAENLAAAGKKAEATAIYTHIRDTRTGESEAYVRRIAGRALAG